MSQATLSRPSLAERYADGLPALAETARAGARPFSPTASRTTCATWSRSRSTSIARMGSHKWDVDGHELIDYWSGHGAILLGHSHPAVVEAVQRQMERATHPGACHEREIEWGQWVQRLVPSAERMRFASSGTEATLMALRLARIFTGRPRVLKFAGHFHGWHDFLIPGADCPHDDCQCRAFPPRCRQFTVIIPPNDLDAVERTLRDDPQIGCVILEPTGGHWGQVPVRGPFLQGTARDHDAARSPADLRRSHHRLPRLAGRGAGALRRQAGPDDAGEDPGRRSAGRLRGRSRRHPRGIWSFGPASRR